MVEKVIKPHSMFDQFQNVERDCSEEAFFVRKTGVHQRFKTQFLKSNMAWVLIHMQKSVFLPLWDNNELNGRKILHIERFFGHII